MAPADHSGPIPQNQLSFILILLREKTAGPSLLERGGSWPPTDLPRCWRTRLCQPPLRAPQGEGKRMRRHCLFRVAGFPTIPLMLTPPVVTSAVGPRHPVLRLGGNRLRDMPRGPGPDPRRRVGVRGRGLAAGEARPCAERHLTALGGCEGLGQRCRFGVRIVAWSSGGGTGPLRTRPLNPGVSCPTIG